MSTRPSVRRRLPQCTSHSHSTIRLMIWRTAKVEASQPRRWALDRESPFEKIRVLDPPPNRRKNALAMAEMRALFAALGG